MGYIVVTWFFCGSVRTLGGGHRRPPYKPLAICLEVSRGKLFLDSKSGAFQLEDSQVRSTAALERLYLVTAIAILYANSGHGCS